MRSIPFLVILLLPTPLLAQPLPGTKPLHMQGDLARQMLEGIDRYLDKDLAAATAQRQKSWKPDFSSAQAFTASVRPQRERLKKIIGAVDPRVPFTDIEYVGGPRQSALVAETPDYTVHAVRWPVLPGVSAEGLLLDPKKTPRAAAVALPDADWTPEQLAGLAPGTARNSQVARRLAEDGFRVLVPTLINRRDDHSNNPSIKRFTNQPHREFIYRMAYQMGRHIIGYEVQKVLAAVDWLARDKNQPPIYVFGYGEGGLIALYSGALDERILGTHVSGYVKHRNQLHDEPIYRNVWGLHRLVGDAELMVLAGSPDGQRFVHVEDAAEPAVTGPPAAKPGRAGAAPGSLQFRREYHPAAEFERFRALAGNIGFTAAWTPAKATAPFAALLNDRASPLRVKSKKPDLKAPEDRRKDFDADVRHQRQFDQLVGATQKLLPAATPRRDEFFWSKLDTSSVAKFEKSQHDVRDYFWKEIIGKLPEPVVPMNPRSRLVFETPKWKGYEVVLDVYQEVFCFGILLVPNDIKPGEKRPCVVCQHGLEGRPIDVVNPKERTKYYNSFGAQLADLGFVVFAPQNPYIFKNDFRQVVRKANPLQLSLYSFIVRQHQRILEWLKGLDFVDGARIAYYGLSYGGKVAMRIPALLLDYCLSICSGDFNEWIWKNITLDWGGSYMFTGEYEMFEFDLGNTFNYAEMAALIAPRPFMVERGHSDGVGLDEYVAFEYAKVRRLYARLGIADRTDIEFFTGGHEINLKGTLAFLRKHLKFGE